eukprot:SAG31_NODE_777_length_12167_cov_6.570683_11_plen_215_part_00
MLASGRLTLWIRNTNRALLKLDVFFGSCGPLIFIPAEDCRRWTAISTSLHSDTQRLAPMLRGKSPTESFRFMSFLRKVSPEYEVAQLKFLGEIRAFLTKIPTPTDASAYTDFSSQTHTYLTYCFACGVFIAQHGVCMISSCLAVLNCINSKESLQNKQNQRTKTLITIRRRESVAHQQHGVIRFRARIVRTGRRILYALNNLILLLFRLWLVHA